MAVETATYIGQLNAAFPAGGEPIAQGDDHLRLIKTTLQNSFPGLNSAWSAGVLPFSAPGFTATNAQAALQELDSEKVSKSGDTMTGTLIAPKVEVGTSGAGTTAVGTAVQQGSIELRADTPFIDFKRDGSDFKFRIAQRGDNSAIDITPSGITEALSVRADGRVYAGNLAAIYSNGDTAFFTRAGNEYLSLYSGHAKLDASSMSMLSSGGSAYQVTPGGHFCVGLTTTTTGQGTAALEWTGSSHALRVFTSSRRFKQDIQDSPYGLADVLKLRSVTFRGIQEHDKDATSIGLIAEEVADVGLDILVQRRDGEVSGVNYNHIISMLVKSVQELTARIAELEAK